MICSDNFSLHNTENLGYFLGYFLYDAIFSLKKALLERAVNYFSVTL